MAAFLLIMISYAALGFGMLLLLAIAFLIIAFAAATLVDAL